MLRRLMTTLAAVTAAATLVAQTPATPQVLPAGPMTYGDLSAQFYADGTWVMGGDGWPKLTGTWKVAAGAVEFVVTEPSAECPQAGRYTYAVEGTTIRFGLLSDDCESRRYMLKDSVWRRAGEKVVHPPRTIVTRTHAPAPAGTRDADTRDVSGTWPSFRGPLASGVADGQQLPDTWNVDTGDHMLWKTRIAGLAHSSPVV